MIKRTLTLAILFLCIGGLAVAGTKEPKSNPDSEVKEVAKSLPSFPYSQGWLGADDAYSIPLTPTKSVWLFGDTFVADPGVTLRTKAKNMARNTVGISTCESSKECTIQYYWTDPKAEKPRSFFDTGREDIWYWPFDGFFDGKTLYLTAMIVRNKKGAGPEDPFGFEIAGTQWFTVHNPMDTPDKWKIDSKELTDDKLWVGSSTFGDGDFVYFYSQVPAGEGKGFMTVVRRAKSKLGEASGGWEYLGTDNKWRDGLPKGDSAKVIDQAISEMSVRYHPSVKKWVAISGGPEFPTNYIAVRTADTPIGPWSNPVKVFEFPEMNPQNAGYDKDTFCYATKEHTEFGNTKLVITYACNSFKLQRVIDNMSLYKPQVIVVDIPK
jgi:hypothetical protein